MKGFVISLLPLAVSSAVITSRAPQTINPNSPLGPIAGLLKGLNSTQASAAIIAALPKAKLYQAKNVAPQIRAGAKRVKASYGPYILPGKGVRDPL
jgi:hypothetical protein